MERLTFGYRSLPFNEIPLFFFLSLLFLPFRKIEGENEFFGNAIELIMRSLSSEIYYMYIYIYTSIRFIGATLLENLKLIVPLEFLFPLFKFKFSLDISLKIFHVYNFYNLEKGKICEKRYRPL